MPIAQDRPEIPPRRQYGRLLVLPSVIGFAVYQFGLPMEPDASYYVGGVSLFPSPIGTLLGTAGGYTGLAILNAIASAAIILLVGLIARELGGQPLLAQALALLLARGSWFQHWGMDTPGVALLLAGALFHLRAQSKLAILFVVLGAATHLAALPLALGALLVHSYRRSAAGLAVALVAFGTAVAYFSGYRAGFHVLREPHAFIEGANELVLACWPLLLLALVVTFHPRVRLLFIGAAVGAILAGAIPASVGQLGWTRYAVPCIFIAVAGVRIRAQPKTDMEAAGAGKNARAILPARRSASADIAGPVAPVGPEAPVAPVGLMAFSVARASDRLRSWARSDVAPKRP